MVAVTVPVLAGCDLGHPGGFTARSNSYCRDSTKQIAALSAPHTAIEQLQYATDRYAIMEHLVSVMTDSSLPGGTDGAQLRASWLRPARASLTAGRTVLADLRTAVNAHPAATRSAGSVTSTEFAEFAEFDQALAIGTQHVDTDLLQARGLVDCAKVFEPTVVPA